MAFAVLTALGTTAQEKKAISPRSVESAVLMGVEAYERGDIDKAEPVFKTLLARVPDNDAAWYYLGLCRMSRRDAEGAEEYLRRAVDLDPDNYWYRYRLAGLYAMTGRPEVTGNMYEELLRDFPKKSELYYNLIDIYITQKQYDRALETLDKIETVFGTSDATVMTRYRLLLALERQDDAHKCLLDYNREFSSPQILSVLGDYEASLYRDSTALAYYDEALACMPDYIPAVMGKAEVFRMTGRMGEYFPLIRGVMADDGVSTGGKSAYLTELCRHSDPKFLTIYQPSVDGLFDAALQAAPKDSSLLYTSGAYYFSTGRKDLADSCFRTVAEEYPDDIKAVASYVSLLSYKEDWNAVLEKSTEAMARFPEEPGFVEYAAGAAYNLKDYDKVISLYSVMASAPSAGSDVKVHAYAGMGDMYHLKGDSRMAYKCYDRALAISPDYIPVLNNYAYYLSVERKKLRKAYAMSGKTVDAEPDNPTYLDTYGWILYLQGNPREAKGFFKHAMLYGGKDSAVILDHYAEVLYALGEYDMAFLYWRQALAKDWREEIPDLEERVAHRRETKDRK